MASFTKADILAATKAKCLQEGKAEQFAGVSTDTRTITAGDIFIALTGENFDGHAFAAKAVDNGAAGVIVSRPCVLPEDVSTYLVDDTKTALEQLASFHRQRFSIPVIAVTGSNGKTTTKDMAAHVLASRYKVRKTHANFNNEIGMSKTLLALDEQDEAAVVEMGMRARGEITHMAEVAKPTVGIVTVVGETHMELLGSVENIAAAKQELVQALPADGIAILNNDNHFVAAMQAAAACRVITFGIENASDVMAEDIVVQGTGSAFTLRLPSGCSKVLMPQAGRHNVYNALAAAAAAYAQGLTADEIAEALASVELTAMRQTITQKGSYTIINDAYNASPMSMSAAIETLTEIAHGRRIAVVGDMLELGKIEISAHRRVGEELAEHGIEAVITLGTLAENIAAAATAGGVDCVRLCHSHEEAEQALRETLQAGDTVLLKGSRSMKMETLLSVFS